MLKAPDVVVNKGVAKAGDVSNHRLMPHDASPGVNVISLNLMTRESHLLNTEALIEVRRHMAP